MTLRHDVAKFIEIKPFHGKGVYDLTLRHCVAKFEPMFIYYSPKQIELRKIK